MQELRNIRLRKGLSQANLSERTGVAEVTISEAEAGKRTPRPSTLRKLAQGLGVEVEDLYGGPSFPKAPPRSALPDDLREALDKVSELRGKWEHHDEVDVTALEEEINTLAPFLQVTLNREMEWLRTQFPGEQDVTERAVVGPQIAAYLQLYMDAFMDNASPATSALVEQLMRRHAS